MNAISKYLLKMFWVVFLSMSVIWVMVKIAFQGFDSWDIKEAIIIGLSFSLFMTIFYRYRISKTYDKDLEALSEQELKARQKRHVRSKLTLFEVKRKLIESAYFQAKKVSSCPQRLSGMTSLM